jgi:hypothetical protein
VYSNVVHYSVRQKTATIHHLEKEDSAISEHKSCDHPSPRIGLDGQINRMWQERPAALLSLRSMCILDSFRGRNTEEVKKILKSRNTDQVIIPGGLTSMLQQFNVCINRPFKAVLKEQYTRWMAAGEHEYMPTGKIKRPDVERLCQWIREAWIEKSFNKCGISNKFDGTEDDHLWDSDPDHVSSVYDDNDKSSREEYLKEIFSLISHSFDLMNHNLNMIQYHSRDVNVYHFRVAGHQNLESSSCKCGGNT